MDFHFFWERFSRAFKRLIINHSFQKSTLTDTCTSPLQVTFMKTNNNDDDDDCDGDTVDDENNNSVKLYHFLLALTRRV